MDIQQQPTSQTQPIDYNNQTMGSIMESIAQTIIKHFPEYIMKHQEHSSSVYLYLCDSLQKDLQITDNIPYLEFWVTSKNRKYRTRYKSHYKVRIDSSISMPRKTISCEYKTLENFHRRIRNAITKLKHQLEAKEARRKAAEAERIQRDKEEAIKLQTIKDCLISMSIPFQIDQLHNRIIVAGDIQVHKVDEEYIYVWHQGLKRVYACNFKEYIEAYKTFNRLAHDT